jgi:hypothetical protein
MKAAAAALLLVLVVAPRTAQGAAAAASGLMQWCRNETFCASYLASKPSQRLALAQRWRSSHPGSCEWPRAL